MVFCVALCLCGSCPRWSSIQSAAGMPATALDRRLMDLIRAIARAQAGAVRSALAAEPSLATASVARGATRQEASSYFLDEIAHYVYGGDTALHVAAAAFRRPIAELLVASGASVSARNRRGAQPLHYAADANRFEPLAQADIISYLLSVGADANARDKSGVAPLHRAVRTRSSAAVKALLDGGADPGLANGSGTLPMALASMTTGASGSGTERARAEQARIQELLGEAIWSSRKRN